LISGEILPSLHANFIFTKEPCKVLNVLDALFTHTDLRKLAAATSGINIINE